MRIVSAEALILDVVDLHEVDRIVTFLTSEEGTRRGVARGARRKYGRFAGELQPLAKVAITWFEKEGRELVRLRGVELIRPAQRLLADLEGILLGGYLAGHLIEFAQENARADHLYRLLDSTTEALLAGVDRQLAARYFEAWVLRLEGIFPAPRECPHCGGPLAAGSLVPVNDPTLICARCGEGSPGGFRASGALLEFLHRIGRESLPAMAERPPAPATLHEAETLAAIVRRHFLHHELRSYEVMQRTLASL